MDYWRNIKIETNSGVIKNITKLNRNEINELYIKCATNPIYVIETFFTVFDQRVNAIVPFKLFPFQKKIITSYETHRLNLTNKYRQAGISTITCAYLAYYISFRSNRKVAIVADKLETARDELMKDVVDFIDMLPPFLHPRLDKPNKATHKGYANKSEVKAFATKRFRGLTPTFVFWDETAHAEKGDEFWTATWPSLGTGGHCAFVSCVTDNTFVWTENGLQEIGDLVDRTLKEGYFVDEYGVLGKDKVRYGNLMYNNGINATKKIKSNFTEIEATKTHKIFSYNSGNGNVGYNNVNNISTGDLLAIQYGMKNSGKNNTIKNIVSNRMNKKVYNYKLNSDLIYLLSMYAICGDQKNLPEITYVYFNNISIQQYNKIRKILIEKLKIKEKFISYENKKLTVNSYKLWTFYRNADLKDFKKTKKLPKFILQLEYNLLKDFIIYLFQYKRRLILNSKSHIFLKQVQQILINIGYLSNIVNQSTYLNNFSVNNKFILKLYSISYNDFINQKQITYDYNIPLGFINYINKIHNLDLGFKYYTYLELRDLIKNNIKYNILNNYFNDTIYYDKINEVKSAMNYTYDFSLPNNKNDEYAHSVIYNGIIGHQTPNGLDPVFYKTYAASKVGKSQFNVNEIYWYEDPRYNENLKWVKKIKTNDDPNEPDKEEEHIIQDNNQENFKKYIIDGYEPTSPWFEGMCKEYHYNKHKINQELKGDFLGSGNNFIDNLDIQYIEKTHIEEPIRKEIDDNTWIWEEPIPEAKYLITVDVSSGTAEDSSTIVILKIEENHLEEVLEYEGKVSPDILGQFVYRYGLRYNKAYAVIDITGGIGVTTVQTLIDLGYPLTSIHYSLIRNEKIKERLISYAREIDDKTYLPGFTIGTNRGMVLIEMKRVIEMKEIIIRSSRMTGEFKTFVTHESRVADHRRSFHDDLIMALAMGIYVIAYDFKSLQNDKEKLDKIIEAIEKMNNINNDEMIIKVENSNYQQNDYNWLFKGLDNGK